MKLKKLYDATPIFIQNIMISIKGWRNSKRRYGKHYYEHLRFLSEFEKLSLDQKKEYQREKLAEIVKFAYENCEFYREFYRDVDISSIKTVEDLEKLPILTKELLRENIEGIAIKKGCSKSHTGGTTGKSLTIWRTDRDLMERMATLDYFKSKVGFINLKMKRATFNGKHIVPSGQKKKVFWRHNPSCKQMIFSSFHITEENLEYYVAELNRFKPQAIDGFFTSMCDVARYIDRHQIKLEFTPIAIFPTSETLTAEGRELLERVFCCKVYNQYASSEGAPFVYECEKQALHMDLSSGVFEALGDSEVLVSSFTSHGTPLIRYRIGDRMTFASPRDVCPCGCNLPLVTSIEGRRLDFLYTAEGAKINSGNVSNILKYIPNAVIRCQFVQKEKSVVTLLMEVDEALYKPIYDKQIAEEFACKFGDKTKLAITHVKEIPREKSGKFRMIKNLVEE